MFMRQIFGLLFLLSIAACGDRTQMTNITTVDTAAKVTDTTRQETSSTVSNPYGFDTSYEISKKHQPFMVTGYFNPDDILDTAILIRHKSAGKDALFIKHGGTDRSILLKNGKDVGSDFPDFNWVGQFEIKKKGTKIWNNVIDGEIVGEEQVPENKKITLKTDGIFVHIDEGGGGGIIYFKNGKYVWVQQD
jgi:hypothetical protein